MTPATVHSGQAQGMFRERWRVLQLVYAALPNAL